MGWKRGQWLAVCDVCGFEFLSGKLKKRWDGLMVDDACFESRHPQEFVRPVKESSIPWARPEPTDIDISPNYPEWLYPPMIGNVNQFFAPEVGYPQTLAPSLLTNANEFYSPTIEADIVYVSPGLLTNTNTFYAPTVTRLLQELSASLVTNTNTFYAPTVAHSFLHTGTMTFDGDDGYGTYYGFDSYSDWSIDGTNGAYTNSTGENCLYLYLTGGGTQTIMGFVDDLNGINNIQIRKNGGTWYTFSRDYPAYYSYAGDPFTLNGSGACTDLYEVVAA